MSSSEGVGAAISRNRCVAGSEHFYIHLKPWVHYVPVRYDLSDVVEKFNWALDHDDEVRSVDFLSAPRIPSVSYLVSLHTSMRFLTLEL